MAAQACICAAAPVVSIAKATPAKVARPAILAPAVNQWAKKTVSNGIKTSAMMVWTPTNNKCVPIFDFLMFRDDLIRLLHNLQVVLSNITVFQDFMGELLLGFKPFESFPHRQGCGCPAASCQCWVSIIGCPISEHIILVTLIQIEMHCALPCFSAANRVGVVCRLWIKCTSTKPLWSEFCFQTSSFCLFAGSSRPSAICHPLAMPRSQSKLNTSSTTDTSLASSSPSPISPMSVTRA